MSAVCPLQVFQIKRDIFLNASLLPHFLPRNRCESEVYVHSRERRAKGACVNMYPQTLVEILVRQTVSRDFGCSSDPSVSASGSYARGLSTRLTSLIGMRRFVEASSMRG